jgi:SAM-dependent methyltransferase
MLKMFQQQADSGETPEFWDVSWDHSEGDGAPDEASCENSSLLPLLLRTLRRDRLFLEGGCGPGHWVSYFHSRGYRVVGVDFAPRAVNRLRRLLPDADVRIGDITHLPFSDGEVHAYYSGGVVEHDESGPEPALREAKRVLAPDGWFLCSVPDASPLRNILYRGPYTERRDLSPAMVVKRVQGTATEAPPADMTFFQYVFTKAEFKHRLHQAGFEVVDDFGYSLEWGLLEIPGAHRLLRALRPPRAPSSTPADAGGATENHRARRIRLPGVAKEWLVRGLLREDRTIPAIGPAIGWAAEHMANLRMYIARPRGPEA